MITVFRQNFPSASAECAAVEDAILFDDHYDGVIAWGLMFLLPSEIQRIVIQKVSRALKSGGQSLFTAPRQVCSWADAMTGLPSVSLGYDAYREILRAAGLSLGGKRMDEGGNFYYLCSKA